LNLYLEQKESLFKNINLLADQDIIKQSVWYENQKQKLNSIALDSFLTKEHQVSLKRTLRSQNFTEDEIDIKIKEILENIKKAELRKLESQLGKSR
jgi:hypothetical protein